MKRFLLFIGPIYYPAGGWEDFVKDFETLEEAEEYRKKIPKEDYDWFQIVDTKTMKIVNSGSIELEKMSEKDKKSLEELSKRTLQKYVR